MERYNLNDAPDVTFCHLSLHLLEHQPSSLTLKKLFSSRAFLRLSTIYQCYQHT
jgi:hypothetical protein